MPADNRQNRSLSSDASALERLPHLAQKICALWGQPGFEPLVNQLIMDSRDGARQGLPWESALELLFLVELTIAKRALTASESTGQPFKQIFEKYLSEAARASEREDPWSDPGANRQLSGSGRDRNRNRRTRPTGDHASPTIEKKKSWWRRIFG